VEQGDLLGEHQQVLRLEEVQDGSITLSAMCEARVFSVAA
jgi:hypothetical protein